MDFYENLKGELLARYNTLMSLTQQSKIKGDYTEALVRDFIRRVVPQKFKVGHGIVYNSRTGQTSKECDVIVYDALAAAPLFHSQDLVVVDSDNVNIVMQIKSTIDSNTMREATKNLESVKSLNGRIIGWIFGFRTTVMLKTLYLKAWRSHVVQFLHILQSTRKSECIDLLNNQTRIFVEMIRHYTSPTIGARLNGIDYFVLYEYPRGNAPAITLTREISEDQAKQRINNVYNVEFWNNIRGQQNTS